MTIGRDDYWELTHLEEIVAMARTHAEECSAKSEEDIRHCATKAVQSHVQFSAAGKEETIVRALIDEVVRIVHQGA